METRLIFAVLLIFVSWFFNFLLKIAAERKYNISLIYCYSYFIMTICLWIYLLFNLQIFNTPNIYIVLLLSFLNWLFYFLGSFAKIESMKNIDTVIVFPLYKTFWPIIVTLISLFFFNESLEIKEIVGIIIGILVPLWLITKVENKRQNNLYLWVFLVLVSAILTAITSWVSKEIMFQNYSFILYLFFSCAFWVVFSFLSYKFFNKNTENKTKWLVKLSIFIWLTNFISFIFFMLALKWNLAVIFTIWSFSILVPIILSIIFFKDHFNLRKAIIIILSIVSIILFI